MKFISENASRSIFVTFCTGLCSMIWIFFMKLYIKSCHNAWLSCTLQRSSTHLVSNTASTTTSISHLIESFFFCCHTFYRLILDIQGYLHSFKIKLAKHYWNMASTASVDGGRWEGGWKAGTVDGVFPCVWGDISNLAHRNYFIFTEIVPHIE